MWPVVLRDDLRSDVTRRGSRHRREQLRVTDRPVEVDEEAAGGRCDERCPGRRGKRLGHRQRTGVPTSVGVQQRPMFGEERTKRRGYDVAAMFARDELDVRHDAVTNGGRVAC